MLWPHSNLTEAKVIFLPPCSSPWRIRCSSSITWDQPLATCRVSSSLTLSATASCVCLPTLVPETPLSYLRRRSPPSLLSCPIGDPCQQLSLPRLWNPGRCGLAWRPRPANDQWHCGVCGLFQGKQRTSGLLEMWQTSEQERPKHRRGGGSWPNLSAPTPSSPDLGTRQRNCRFWHWLKTDLLWLRYSEHGNRLCLSLHL